jgi:hypothetical protein
MKYIKMTVMIVVMLCAVGAAYALDKVPDESGFSGFVRFGVGVMSYESNTVAGNRLLDIGDETVNSLYEEPESDTSGIAIFNFDLSWTFAGTRTQLFLGSQLEDIARFDLTQQIGVKQELKDKSILAVSYVMNSIPTEVWEDPYITGVSRQKTDRDSKGVRITYDKILGSNFQAQYTYRDIDIDIERSGSAPALDLSQSQRDLLRRDGERHSFELLYRIELTDEHVLVPAVYYIKEDRDGDAMSNDEYDVQFSYSYLGDPVTVIVNAIFGSADYDADNPIYNKSRDDDIYSLGAQIYYKNPFGWRPFGLDKFSVFAQGVYFDSDSDIDFYDTKVALGLVGVLVRF